MDKAKAAVGDFLHKSGRHDTTIHETVAPAVEKETVKPTRHEEVTTAIDREVHQHHHHTSVQPVIHKEILPEQHTHNIVAVEHRTHDHGGHSDIKAKVAEEAAKFKHERVVSETTHTHSVAPIIAGEHVHHHVHEVIQPVVHKETIQPQVVHTTVPVHEVHHNTPQHHATSALPAVSMHDFKSQGGVLGGREERTDGFEGEPRSLIGGAGHTDERGTGLTDTGTTGRTTRVHDGVDERGEHERVGGGGLTGAGTGLGGAGTGVGQGTRGGGLNEREDVDRMGGTGTGTGLGGTHGRGLNNREDVDRVGGTGHHTGTTGGIASGGNAPETYDSSARSKPSLMDKLNPKTDTTGDGKKGIMK